EKAMNLPPPERSAERPSRLRVLARHLPGQQPQAPGAGAASNGSQNGSGTVPPSVLLPTGPHGSGADPASCPAMMLEHLSNDVVRHVGHALDDDAAMLLLLRD